MNIKRISEKIKMKNQCLNYWNLEKKIKDLEKKRTQMRNDLNIKRDEIDRQNEQLQENIRKKL